MFSKNCLTRLLTIKKFCIRSLSYSSLFSQLAQQRAPNSLKMSAQTIKTRILIISDTHSTPLAPASSSQPFRQPLPSADVLIHCGDLTMEGLTSEYRKTLDMLASIDAPVKLIIAGNHDRTLDKTWAKTHEKSFWGKKWEEVYEEAREMWFGKEGRAVKEGVTMLEEGVHELELRNGAVLKVGGLHLFLPSLFTLIFVSFEAKNIHEFSMSGRYCFRQSTTNMSISFTPLHTNPNSTTGRSLTRNTRIATTLQLKPFLMPKTLLLSQSPRSRTRN
jgi:predicted phosphodiesterase